MSDVELNDRGHENALSRGEFLAASAIAQFYTFASRCMDWAKTSRSLQERMIYAQMALQWLAAAARLQTLAQFKNPQDVPLKPATQMCDAAHHRQIESDREGASQDPASDSSGLNDVTDE
jgi:hypothetical protein